MRSSAKARNSADDRLDLLFRAGRSHPPRALGPPRGKAGDGDRACRTVRDVAPRRLAAHPGPGAGSPGGAKSRWQNPPLRSIRLRCEPRRPGSAIIGNSGRGSSRPWLVMSRPTTRRTSGQSQIDRQRDLDDQFRARAGFRLADANTCRAQDDPSRRLSGCSQPGPSRSSCSVVGTRRGRLHRGGRRFTAGRPLPHWQSAPRSTGVVDHWRVRVGRAAATTGLYLARGGDLRIRGARHRAVRIARSGNRGDRDARTNPEP